MKYIIPKNVYIDKDEITEIAAIEHDTKTRFINFKFICNSAAIDLTACKVRVYAKNSRYIDVFNDLTILDAKRGIAQLELTDKFLRPGVTEYQLKIMPIDGGQLSSNVMKITVGKDFMAGAAIESSNEYKVFENALKTIDKYDLRLKGVESRFTEGTVITQKKINFADNLATYATLEAKEQLEFDNNKVYDEAHKPTPEAIGAVSNTGDGKITGRLIVGGKPGNFLDMGVGDDDVAFQNTKSGKWLQLKNTGELRYDNKKVLLDIQNSPLWEGYHHMASKESVTPSKPLSKCNGGWVIVWSDWDDGSKGQNWNICYSYVPKNTIFKNGHNTNIPLCGGESSWAIKTLYIYDSYFTGDDTNKTGANYDVVIRAVLEY